MEKDFALLNGPVFYRTVVGSSPIELQPRDMKAIVCNLKESDAAGASLRDAVTGEPMPFEVGQMNDTWKKEVLVWATGNICSAVGGLCTQDQVLLRKLEQGRGLYPGGKGSVRCIFLTSDQAMGFALRAQLPEGFEESHFVEVRQTTRKGIPREEVVVKKAVREWMQKLAGEAEWPAPVEVPATQEVYATRTAATAAAAAAAAAAEENVASRAAIVLGKDAEVLSTKGSEHVLICFPLCVEDSHWELHVALFSRPTEKHPSRPIEYVIIDSSKRFGVRLLSKRERAVKLFIPERVSRADGTKSYIAKVDGNASFFLMPYLSYVLLR